MKRILLLVVSLFLMTSLFAQSKVIMTGDFRAVYNRAKNEKKKLFVILDYKDNGHSPSSLIVEQLVSNKIDKKYKDNYLFYKCNTKLDNNAFVSQILLHKGYPAVCVFDETGTLVCVNDEKLFADEIEKMIINVSKGVKYHSPTKMFTTRDSAKLLEMLDYTFKANIKFLSGQNGLIDINKSIFIETNFYNNYLKYKILTKQENASTAKLAREEALKYIVTGVQFMHHEPLIYELNGREMKKK